MLLKNTSGGVFLYAVDTTASPVAGKTGDAANITGSYSLDGAVVVAGFTTAHPTEIATGTYWQPLTAAETNGNKSAYQWASSTSGIVIDPVFEQTTGLNVLAPTGLDGITVTAPATVPTTFTQMMVMLYRRFFSKSTLTSTQLKTLANDGTTVITTQAVSDDSTTQIQGAAT